MPAYMLWKVRNLAVINVRCNKLDKWLRVSKEFQREDFALKPGMPADRRKISENKCLCPMKHIMQEEQYRDKDLVSDLERGSSLVREVPLFSGLPEKLLTATMTTKDLAQNAKKVNIALGYMTRSSGSDDLDQKLWEKMQLVPGRGWLTSPINWDQPLDEVTVSCCFTLDQSGKARPIDDLIQSHGNATVTSLGKSPWMVLMLSVLLLFPFLRVWERQERARNCWGGRWTWLQHTCLWLLQEIH